MAENVASQFAETSSEKRAKTCIYLEILRDLDSPFTRIKNMFTEIKSGI